MQRVVHTPLSVASSQCPRGRGATLAGQEEARKSSRAQGSDNQACGSSFEHAPPELTPPAGLFFAALGTNLFLQCFIFRRLSRQKWRRAGESPAFCASFGRGFLSRAQDRPAHEQSLACHPGSCATGRTPAGIGLALPSAAAPLCRPSCGCRLVASTIESRDEVLHRITDAVQDLRNRLDTRPAWFSGPPHAFALIEGGGIEPGCLCKTRGAKAMRLCRAVDCAPNSGMCEFRHSIPRFVSIRQDLLPVNTARGE